MALRISLEQWKALVSVVEAGGYAQAASALNNSQSTISYAIGQIEERLGLTVFRIEGRKAYLTDEGGILYRRGKWLLEEAVRLERAAENLAKGREQELRIAVETLFPTWLLLHCLRRFSEESPETQIELHESVVGGTDELLLGGHVDMAICADSLPAGATGEALMRYRAIAAGALYLVYPDPDGAGLGARRLGDILREEARKAA